MFTLVNIEVDSDGGNNIKLNIIYIYILFFTFCQAKYTNGYKTHNQSWGINKWPVNTAFIYLLIVFIYLQILWLVSVYEL